MSIIQQVIFVIVAGFAIWLFTKNILKIRRNILLGRDESYNDQPGRRWKNLLLLAFGQKVMFRYPLVALLHFAVYAGFIIINIEVLEIIIDGVAGTHRILYGLAPGLYIFLINAFEVLAISVLLACVFFLVRRNILKLRRFISRDLTGWPRSDANYILITEIILMALFLSMNAADSVSSEGKFTCFGGLNTPDFIISQWVQPVLNGISVETVEGIERGAWWLHILGILAFLNYLPYSKHLHILLAFPNAYYARLEPKGKMKNMPEVQHEVLYAMEPDKTPQNATPPEKFGAKDVFDLSWRNLLDAYSCTECGRCSAACPATQTGKLLSPRKIMMDTRDRLEDVGKNIDKNGSYVDDGKKLLHDYIQVESLRACTSCQACVQECPVSISPLEIILELRRSLIMEESNAPQEWNGMFSNVENNFAPWKFSPDDRDAWKKEIE